ncbi:MAG: hypothetical protein HYX22_01370 [Candidatus Yanofskybacteria bacterium]|nr:hypothetical protein [Candidatus Yanofskybacteria bacterium]
MASYGRWLTLLLVAFKIKTLVILVIGISLLGGPLAYNARATDWFAAMKFGLDTAAKAAAQGAFRAAANRILNKIQTGGIGGGALFVQDWREFQLNSQYRGEEVFRGVLKSTKLCNYFENDLKNIFGANQAVNVSRILTRTNGFDSFQAKTGCTLPNTFDFNAYKQDFSGNGGWEAWSRLLEPQNNYYGVLFQSLDEANRQRAIEESAATNEALAGKGFVGIRDCLVQKEGSSACTILGKIKTPGSTLGEQVASVFDAHLKFYTTADAASLAIAAISEFITNKLFDLASSDTSDSGTALNNENSYRNEFCTAKDNISQEAITYIAANFPQALVQFPTIPGGRSYCEGVRDDDNVFPFERCVNACYKATGLLPDNVDTPNYTDDYQSSNPVCGDNVCSVNENALTCPQDCEIQVDVNIENPPPNEQP